jgi:drug/metabolite transporter (DMT)-like permease
MVQRGGAGIPPTALVAGSMLSSTVLLTPVALLNLPSAPVHAQSWSALVVLGLLCTAVALITFYALIGDVGPNRAGLVTYVNPLVAVALGVAVLHEPLRPSLAVGAVLILGGCWLSTRRAARRPDSTERSPETPSLAAVDGP